MESTDLGRSYEALLFDLDGTLVDSTTSIDQAWIAIAEDYGLEPTPLLKALPGRTARDILEGFLSDSAEIEAAQELVQRKQLAAAGVKAMPGAATLLSDVPAERWAIVTSAPANVALARLEAAKLPTPSVLVSAETVKRGKPDPEGFLRAAEYLGVEASVCLVFEDSSVGIEAGIAAGADTISVDPTSVSAPTATATLQNVEVIMTPSNRMKVRIRR